MVVDEMPGLAGRVRAAAACELAKTRIALSAASVATEPETRRLGSRAPLRMRTGHALFCFVSTSLEAESAPDGPGGIPRLGAKVRSVGVIRQERAAPSQKTDLA